MTKPQNDCVPSKDSDQPGHPPSLIRVFVVHFKDSQGPKLSLCRQQRHRSDWVDAQADLSLRWAHMPFCWFCHDAAHICFASTMIFFKLSSIHCRFLHNADIISIESVPVKLQSPSSHLHCTKCHGMYTCLYTYGKKKRNIHFHLILRKQNNII